MALEHVEELEKTISGLELSTTIASLGTFMAFGPAQRRSKPFPNVFSTLTTEILLEHNFFDKVEEGDDILEVIYRDTPVLL